VSLCPVLGGEVRSAVALEYLLMNKLKINKNRRNKQVEKYDKL